MSEEHPIDIFRDHDCIAVELTKEVRETLLSLIQQLETFNDPNIKESRRLFPTAYNNDPELENGYQVLAQSELVDQKSEAIKMVTDSIFQERLELELAEKWMVVLNDLRLVIGTQLDVSEDDPLDDLSDGRVSLYHSLSLLVELLVESLQEG